MNNDLLLEKAKQHIEKFEYGLALNSLDVVTSKDSYNTEAFYLRGKMNFRLGRHQQALADFNRAIDLGMEEADAYLSRAITYRRLDLPEMSLRDFSRVIQIDPRSMAAYVNRGLAYFSILSDDKAIDDFSHTLALKRSPQHFFYRGLAYSRKGLTDRASADFSDEYLANIETQ